MPIDTQLLERLKKNDPTLTELRFNNQLLTDSDVQNLGAYLNTNTIVTSIDLINDQIDDIGAQALAKILEQNRTLTRISLYNNKIGVVGAQALAKALEKNRTLIEIDLGFNQIGDVGAQALAQALERNCMFTRIALDSNQIGSAGVQALAKAFEKSRTLVSISLKSSLLDEAGAQALAKALEKSHTLTSIDLSYNQMGDAEAQVLAKALEKNHTLIWINLEFNRIGDVGAQALAKALEQNHTLTTINLHWNSIYEAGAQALAKALEQNQTLMEIDLQANPIGDAGAQALAKALEKNRTLMEIDCGSEISDIGAQALAKALEKNRTLTLVRLYDEKISAVIVQAIIKLFEENKERAEKYIHAVKTNDFDRVKQLVATGINLNYRDRTVEGNENTALHIAAEKGYLEILRFLLELGINANLRNWHNKTALELAEVNRHQAIVDLLKTKEQRVEVVPEIAASSSTIEEFSPAPLAEVLSPEEQAEELFNQGYAEYKEANFKVAVKSFNAAIQLNPNQANYFNYRCKVKLALNQFTSALEDISQAILLKPKRAMYYAQRAVIKVTLQNYQAAIEDYTQAIRYKSSKAHYFYGRGKAKAALKQYAEALKDYEQAMQLNEDYAEANEALVAVKVLLKPLQASTETAAATSSHAALSLSSEVRAIKEKADGLYAEGKTHLEDGEIKEAKIAYRKAQDIYKELRSLGIDCQKRLEKIKTGLKQLTAIAPSPIVSTATPPSLQRNDSINKDIAQAGNPPIAAPKKFNAPTANVKAGFFKQAVAATTSISPKSSSQVSSVNGLGSLLQAQPGERGSINTDRSQLRR